MAMRTIVAPLGPGDQGPDVVNLQDGLRRLITGDRLNIDSGEREQILHDLAKESQERVYGGATERTVVNYQGQRQLERTGKVDERTAVFFNRELTELGGLADEGGGWGEVLGALQEQSRTLQAINEGTKFLPNIDGRFIGLAADSTLQKVQQGTDQLQRIGENIARVADANTNLGLSARGDAVRDAQAKLGQAGYALPQAELDEGLLGVGTRDALLRLQAQYKLTPTGALDDATRNALATTATAAAHPNRIEGRVFLDNGLPASGLQLRIVNKGFGDQETELGVAHTDAQGFYALPYAPTGAINNLEVQALRDEAAPMRLSQLKANVGRNEVLNLVAPSALQPDVAEYARLSADLAPLIGEMTSLATAKEDAERQDLSGLHRATGWDARVIALAATAEQLRTDVANAHVSLRQDGLYGLLRAGLPSDKLMLAQVSPDVVEQALTTVRDAGIVGMSNEEIGQFKGQFQAFANATRLSVPAPGSQSTYAQLLATSGLSEDAQAKFGPVFLSHGDDAVQLWQAASDAGLDDAQIGKLQLQGKLAFLTGNSEAMTASLLNREISAPAQFVEQSLYEPGQWKAQITELAGNDEQLAALIPAAYEGATVQERLDAYADDMARKVRLSYPTHVVGHMVAQDDADAFRLGEARADTATLLKNAANQGFRLGQTPAATFFETHAGARAGLSDGQFQAAQQEVKKLHRVYQITPTNEAMPALMSLGLHSAYDVVAVSEDVFVDLYGPKFPSPEQARLVYRKAKQVTNVTYNLFAIAKTIDSSPPLHGVSPPVEVRESVKNELIKHFPTMESLFGSLDFCECEHCRSVLSPAAYLVDLLQFVDTEPAVWDNFLERWAASHNNEAYTARYKKPYEALIERRPDLPHIQLTCENTTTALPYIDIVNEILEYYVAHDTLAEDAAHDTGEATTAELLAEPQNVIREAYDKLREARYPLALPFDLWLETVRQFCAYFETPLARILEVFRPGDDLLAPTQPFDRAAIFVESLGLSPSEAAIFTNPDPLAAWHELYGFASANDATTVAVDADTNQRIDLNSAKALSRRLGVTYKEIVEIVQTHFVNPQLQSIVLLPKLGVTIQDARFYADHKAFFEQNKDLIGADRATLPPADQARYDALTQSDWQTLGEVGAFDQQLQTVAARYGVPVAQLEGELGAIPSDKILVLADPNAGCDFDMTTLRYSNGDPADGIAFLRINLFTRLWRKLSWSIEETDRALGAFVPASASFDTDPAHLAKQPLRSALIGLAHLKALDGEVRVGKGSRLKLLTLWADLPTGGKNALYAQLFLARSVLKADDVFDHPLGQYLSPAWVAAQAQGREHEVQRDHVAPADKLDPAPFAGEPRLALWYDELEEVQHLAYEGVLSDGDKAALLALVPAPPALLSALLDAVQAKAAEFSLVKGHMLALGGALGLSAHDIGRILDDAGDSLDTAALTLPNVSLLYRYGLLARALKLSVSELITLRQLSGLDPFAPLHPDPLETLVQDHPFSQTLRFVEVVGEVKGSGLAVDDLEYLLRHRFDETGKYRANRDETLALLKTLADGVRAIRAEHAVPDDPAALTDEALRQKLGLALPPAVVERFLAMLNGTAEFVATKAGVAAADQLDAAHFTGEPAIGQLAYNPATQTQRLAFRGVLFDQQKASIKNNAVALLTPGQQATLADLLDAAQAEASKQASAFFVKHLQKQQINASSAMGFLDPADFDLLFNLHPALDPGESEQDRLRKRRAKLAQSFLPFLQGRLIRQLALETLTAEAAAEPALVEGLLTDTRLLGLAQPVGAAQPLLDALVATAERGVTATFFATPDGTGAPTGARTLPDADLGLLDGDGNPLTPGGTNSAQLEGYVEVPAPGAYRFYVALGKQNAGAELRFAHLPTPTLMGTAGADGDEVGDAPGEYVELKPGALYRFTLSLRNLAGGGTRLLAQGETLPKDRLAQLPLYPAAAMERAERALLLLAKALQLLQGLGLSEREARYLLTHPGDFAGLDLAKLPTQASDDTPGGAAALFGQFLRLAGYASLKRVLTGGTDDLLGIFEANGAGDMDGAYQQIARLTRRDEATVRAAANALFAAPAFASEEPLGRLWEALEVVERFGVSVRAARDWARIVSPVATPEQRFAIARDLREAIKARFEPEAWQRVAQPIFDKLRQRQRDALVAFVMQRRGFDRMEQLYEYFLIDPGMEPVVQTSRIRLAIGSVQLFIQRCLLNLEKSVHPAAIINAKQWEWMKRYRVWEANRKIFLFPENWLEPEFRDDKTHLFSELEGALLQGDVSDDLVEDAFLAYLKKLEELARLDIVAMHLEDKDDPAQNVLHVIGRTYGLPHTYFYRRYAHAMWTPWEPVTAEIEGDHLAPVIWRDRLYLFWVTFVEKAAPTISNVTVDYKTAITVQAAPAKQLEAQLHWSEYVGGAWSTRESGDHDPPASRKLMAISVEPRTVFVHVSKEAPEDGEERGVFVHLSWPFNQAFYLAGRNSAPERAGYGAAPPNPYSANSVQANRYTGSGELTVRLTQRSTTEPGKQPTVGPQKILQQGAAHSLLPSDNAIMPNLGEIASLIKPVFYQDNTHTLFIEPSVAERTIEDWQEWVTPPPRPEPDWRKPDWWKELVVIPAIPKRGPIPTPEDPWRFVTDPAAIYKVRPGEDWLVNQGTGLLYGGELVGPSGRGGLTVLPAAELAGVDAAGGAQVHVHAGSGIGAESVVVLAGGASLEQSGLKHVAGGLNVVGGSGFNAAMEKNFTSFVG
jgi:Neuraminidase-like domain/Salmonella virulence plasmid 28.1kDa A protein/Putative peptidoglycan binding domain